jgi:acyl transferase domain-containing protein/NADP-dependent 3-hydroxy acid dehydrogenase YdfG/acyl carrier protein
MDSRLEQTAYPIGMAGGLGAGSPGREPIAIVGIGCRLPGGIADPAGMWTALLEGRDAVVDIPGSRWDPQKFLDPTGRSPGRSYVQKAGMLTHDPKSFDAAFFGIPPREAAIMDPQQRLMLQCAWEAFEDAGEPPSEHAGARTAVFVGGFMMDYHTLMGGLSNLGEISTHSAAAGTLTMLSNRLSYIFDLRGPSVSLDTACSSSLVAVHQACQSIWANESDAALAGGVNVLLSPFPQVTMAKGRFLSRKGKCQAFSESADGYVRAEGAVVLLLKPLSAARRDGNTVHAVVLGSATNQDGRTNGITVPNGDAQIEVMRSAYAQARVNPSEVGYVEAHGTGTPVGDPIEARAIGTVMGAGRSGEPCRIGSIKTNVGHAEAAAGVAGVFKAVLCVKHGQVPPHLHLQTVNPAIDLDGLGLSIPTQTETLPRLSGRRVAGVNSFGYGGTNAHVVLAEPPEAERFDRVEPAAEPLLLLSARSPEALHELAGRHAEALADGDVDIATHCRSAVVHRSHHRLRAAFPAGDRAVLIDSLRAYSAEDAAAVEPALERPKLLFVYTGMGPQWWAMGRELLVSSKVFREAAEECDDAFGECSGWSILSELLADESNSAMARTEIAQPANALLQVALTRLWRTWGVQPDAVLGHSVGELGAAYAAQALSLHDTMVVAYHRSRLQKRLAGRGSMLAVGLTMAQASALAERFQGLVSVAAVNAPSSATLAGDAQALQMIAAKLDDAGVFNRFLQVEVPYHSPVMDEIHHELLASLASLNPAPPTVDVYSTATGSRVIDERHDAHYWWHNARGTVRFADALTAAIDDGHRLFMEVGPHPVLAASISDVLGGLGAKGVTIASLIRRESELATMQAALASLYKAGSAVDWKTYFGPGSYTSVPTYPWQASAPWDEPEHSHRQRVRYERHPMVYDSDPGPPHRFVSELSFGALPYLEDHEAAGAVLFPAAGYVELALAAHEAMTQGAACSVEELELHVAVPLDPQVRTRLAVTVAPESSAVSIHQLRDGAEAMLCARAKVFSPGRTPAAVDMDALGQRLTQTLAAEQLYARLADRGLRYGPAFQSVRAVRRAGGEVLARLELPAGVDPAGYHLHPALLDGAFHSLIASADDAPRLDLIPVRINRIHYFGASAPIAYSHGRIVRADADGIVGDLTLLTAEGDVVAEISGFTCQFLPYIPRVEDHQRRLYRRTWIPLEQDAIAADSWLFIDRQGIGAVLEELSRRSEPVALVDVRWAGPAGEADCPVSAGADAATELLETVAALPADKVARYFVITRGGEVLDGDTNEPAVDRALLLGLCRTIISERYELGTTLVDIDDSVSDLHNLPEVLSTVGGEQEVALRAGELWCARIDHAPTPGVAPDDGPATVAHTSDTPFRLELRTTGTFDGLAFVACDRPPPGPDEVEIESHLAPLNYKDILKAMGLLSDRVMRDTYTGTGIGIEVVGRITRVGSSVSGLKVGDRVYAVCPGALQSHVIVQARRAFVLPDGLAMQDSVGMLAMCTAYHGLVKLARLQAGETVLIHGATGGVGLGAIEIARWVGADIIATAGSDSKRQYLRDNGISCITTSRDVSFADDVMAWTDNRGVDVVLSFSPGELMTKSLDCLAPFGRFIEIGKMGSEQNASLSLRPFNENLMFASVDADRMMAHRPDYSASLVNDLLAMLADRQVQPVPVTTFPASSVREAFRLMARSQHVGKVCVDLQDPELTLQADPPRAIRPDATYLVTGGLGGFGLETAKWLAQQGARHLALLSRRGASAPEAQAMIGRLQAEGVTVRAFAADVSSRDDVAAVLQDIAAAMPPLRGVIHSATVLDDRRIADLDRAALDRVLGPKALGAWNLHSLTANLDFFVMYSSISSLLGNPGQGNYVAANAVLDALGQLRRRRGLPASVIQWGVLGQTGIVARDANVARHLAQMGITAVNVNDALLALGEVIDADLPSLTVAEADWSRFAAALPPLAGERRLALLTAGDVATSTHPAQVIELFTGLAEEARQERVETTLATIVAGVMGMTEPTFAMSQPLRDLGMDSIMGLEIGTAIEKTLGLRLSAVELAAGPSIEQLARIILVRLAESLAA